MLHRIWFDTLPTEAIKIGTQGNEDEEDDEDRDGEEEEEEEGKFKRNI